jgi:molybdopterin converting factor small subunit
MKHVQIECLGAFRELGDTIRLEVEGDTIGDVRRALAAYLEQSAQTELTGTLARSAFAVGDQMCQDSDPYQETTISVLPPVAGG